MGHIQVYLMKEYPAIVESSKLKQSNKQICYQVCYDKWRNRTLTVAHCKRNADGASISTGHESWTHAATAMACKNQEKLYMQPFSNTILEHNKYSSVFSPREEGLREKRERGEQPKANIYWC